MVLYNLTNASNANNFYEFTKAMDSLTDGWLIIFILLSLFFVVFMSYKTREEDTSKVLVLASFVTTMIGMAFLFVDLLSLTTLMYAILLLVGSVFYHIWTTSRD